MWFTSLFMDYLGFIILIVGFLSTVLIIRKWIVIYNQFQRWRSDSKQKFADVKVVIKQRIAMLDVLAQITKQYASHEADSFSDVTKARSRLQEMEEDASFEDQAAEVSNIEAIFEDYPELEAGELFNKLMGKANVGEIEDRFRKKTKAYNKAVERFNYHRRKFPTNLVAKIHSIESLDFITFSEEYDETDFFKED